MIIPLVILFLLLAALFSGSEAAFLSANKLKVELRKKRGTRRSVIIAGFFEKPAAFLDTLLVGYHASLVLFTTFMVFLLQPALQKFTQSEWALVLLMTLIIGVIVLIFGEFLPKALFRPFGEDALHLCAYPLQTFKLLLAPPSWLMTRLSAFLVRLVSQRPASPDEQVSAQVDLQNLIRESKSDQEGGSEIDSDLFGKALNLKDTRVRDIMVPRTEIESIDVNASVAELEQLFSETKLSRILVIQEDIDNVLGYVHHQQLLMAPKNIHELVLDISFVPEVMRVTDLMSKFIKDRLNIACVVDEFGGMAGLITLEDILEEIFGEIEDEHDEEEYVELQQGENEYLFSGRLEIDYINEKYPNLNLPKGEYHTLSGYLVMTFETIPELGAEIILNGYKFILEGVSDTKIETIRVIKLPTES